MSAGSLYKNILIVDDQEDNLVSIEAILKSNLNDIEIFKSFSVDNALKILMENRVDVVITDLMMPRIDGIAFAKMLKSYKKTRDIPIIMMTASKDSRKKIDFLKVGGVDFLTKPVEIELIVTKLKNIFSDIDAKRESEKRIKSLEEIDKLKDEYLSIFSHELKTPLNAILNFSSLIKRRVETDRIDKEMVAKLSQLIYDNALVMLDNTENILNIKRLEDGRLKAKIKVVKIKPIILKVLDHYSSLLLDKDINLNLDDIEVYSDENLLFYLFKNIISNAIKYGDSKIYIESKREDFDCFVKICDDGKGVKKGEKIFDLFFMSEEIVHKSTTGTGVGLYFVKKICETLKIEYYVANSTVLKGAEFSFKIPIFK